MRTCTPDMVLTWEGRRGPPRHRALGWGIPEHPHPLLCSLDHHHLRRVGTASVRKRKVRATGFSCTTGLWRAGLHPSQRPPGTRLPLRGRLLISGDRELGRLTGGGQKETLRVLVVWFGECLRTWGFTLHGYCQKADNSVLGFCPDRKLAERGAVMGREMAETTLAERRGVGILLRLA